MANASLLVVEDDRVSRDALRVLARHMGFEVHLAADLREATLYLLEKIPDVLILDLMLPDGHGSTLLAAVRKRGLATKVAVVTAITDQTELHKVLSLSPDALFGKPIDVNDFEGWLVRHSPKEPT